MKDSKFRAKLKVQKQRDRYRAAHGIEWEEKQQRISRQDGRCANPGCRTTKPGRLGWHTDHCHTTGKLRDELCAGCNMSLGMLKDSPERIAGLLLYLEKHEVTLWGTH